MILSTGHMKELICKRELVKELSKTYTIFFPDIVDIEYRVFTNRNDLNEFIVLTWDNGAISTANNNINSLGATARNVSRMLDGGVYENLEFYKRLLDGASDYVDLFK